MPTKKQVKAVRTVLGYTDDLRIHLDGRRCYREAIERLVRENIALLPSKFWVIPDIGTPEYDERENYINRFIYAVVWGCCDD